MAELLDISSEDRVTVLTLSDPPVNALGGAMRQALSDAFAALPEADQAVIIMGAGACFCGGVDLRELAPQKGVPTFGEVMDLVESCSKPVIAALHGAATGGGLELAQACHFRVSTQGTRVGQPEVTMGFPPGGGATQRLPRLIGVAPALTMLLSGQLIPDSKAIELGLIDARAKGQLRRFAIEYAKQIVAEERPIRRSRDRRDHLLDGTSNQREITRFRARVADSPLTAPKRVIDCVEAALLLPFEAGLAFEQAAFEEAIATPQSEALRYLARAERQALFRPEAASHDPRPITRVGVLGQGKRALDLTVLALQAGLEIRLAGPSDMALPAHVKTWFERAVAQGRLSADQSTRALERLSCPVRVEALSEIDLLLDAGPPGTVDYASLPLSDETILTLVQDGADLAGLPDGTPALALGFGLPAITNELFVLSANEVAPSETVHAVLHLCRRLAKQSVVCQSARPDLVLRLLATWLFAAETCLRDGATPYEVDRAMRALGCARGPYQLLDLAGLNGAVAQLAPRQIARHPLPGLLVALRGLSRFGRRSQAGGVYLYDATHPQGREDPEMVDLCAELRAAHGLPERRISSAAIQRRCLIALANEEAYLRAEDHVARVADLDVILHHGLGFPRWRGGAALMADQMGLLAVRRDLDRLAAHDPFIWTPAPLLSDLIKNGVRLSEA